MSANWNADRNSQQNLNQRTAHHHRNYATALCSERHTNADLLRSVSQSLCAGLRFASYSSSIVAFADVVLGYNCPRVWPSPLVPN
jgi:hypothetical protein